MNGYKIRYIVEFIRSKGPLPRDVSGDFVSPADVLAWYGLRHRLTLPEQEQVKRELEAMMEAERFIERLELDGR